MVEKHCGTLLNADVHHFWEIWLQVTKTRCHLHFELEGGGLDSHIEACLLSAMTTAKRIVHGLKRPPRKILEVGSSTGFNCIALSQMFPDAEIYGIEPDGEAVAVASSMVAAAGIDNVHFRQGVGEDLPYTNDEFDLIICLTVIEHVQDVECVIEEMSRVLAFGGTIRLEAPNYVWPYEPHLGIWCFPLLGKKLVKFMATLQGKSDELAYLDHLKFVTPGRLEAAFSKNDLVWDNQVKAKLERMLAGDTSQIMAYKRVATLLGLFARAGLSKLLARLVMWSKLYPSVLYVIKKV